MRENLRKIEKDILGEAYISNETQNNLLILCSYGSRFAGTPSEKQAVDFILRKMKEYNLDNPHTEEVKYLGWKRGKTTLEVTQPEQRMLDCIGLPWSPNTPKRGVETELLARAREWVSSTTPGPDYGGDVVKVYWQCSQCGRRFETVEHLDSILIEVDKLPDTSYRITYRKVEE
jgi:hypothetical protein